MTRPIPALDFFHLFIKLRIVLFVKHYFKCLLKYPYSMPTMREKTIAITVLLLQVRKQKQSYVPCPRSHSWELDRSVFEPRQSVSRSLPDSDWIFLSSWKFSEPFSEPTPSTLSGGWGQMIFIMILNVICHFLPWYPQKCTVEFSRGCMISDVTANVTSLSQMLKTFVKM